MLSTCIHEGQCKRIPADSWLLPYCNFLQTVIISQITLLPYSIIIWNEFIMLILFLLQACTSVKLVRNNWITFEFRETKGGKFDSITWWHEREKNNTSSLYPICIPQSSIIFFPPIVTRMQLRPTSFRWKNTNNSLQQEWWIWFTKLNQHIR